MINDKPFNTEKCESVLYEILEERKNQHEKWGEQDHPMITGSKNTIDYIIWYYKNKMESQKTANSIKNIDNPISWLDIIYEEFCEVFAELDPEKQRAELVQMVAVGVQIIENIDRRL